MQYIITKEQIEAQVQHLRRYHIDNSTSGQLAFDAAISMLQSLPVLDGEPVAIPPFSSKRNAAIALYKAPFKFEHGYIFDAEYLMVADDDDVGSHVAARVRGWGHIGYMPDAAQLQDEVGKYIAELLTKHWNSNPSMPPITADDVTDEVVATALKLNNLGDSPYGPKYAIVAAVNAYLGAKI
jgi:hypothetical protein